MGGLILCQGDSITDWCRDKSDFSSLGQGYVSFFADLLNGCPQYDFTVLNRGISGERSCDLVMRWQTDCVELKPDILTLLVGVNDTYRRYQHGWVTTRKQYEENCRFLIEQTQKASKTEIILMEPFLIDINDEVTDKREDLCEKQAVVRQLSNEYKTRFIALDTEFKRACEYKPASFWSEDGIHPTRAGHMLIALNLLDEINSLQMEGNKWNVLK